MKKKKINTFLTGYVLGLAVALVIILLTSFCHAQTLGEWRWSHQEFMDAPKKNVQHFGTGLISMTLDYTTNLKWWQSDLIAISCGVAWEIKDGFCPYEKFGYWGGEGFSFMDVKIDIAGVAINRILNYSIKAIYKKVKK